MKLLLCLLAVGLVSSQDLPDNILNEPDWGFQSYLNDDFAIPCNHSDLVVEENNYIVWELPSGHKLETGNDKYTLRNVGSVVNMHMVVKNVQESDAGVYLCHVFSNSMKSMNRGHMLRGLNLGGHMYREPFEEYRNNLMVGGLAALCLFVPLVTACLVYKFRYQTDEQKRDKRQLKQKAYDHQRYLDTIGEDGKVQGRDAEMAVVNGGKGQENAGYEMDEKARDINTRL